MRREPPLPSALQWIRVQHDEQRIWENIMKKIIWLLIMVLTVSFSGIRPAFAETVDDEIKKLLEKREFRCGKTFVTFRAKWKDNNFIITLRKSDITEIKYFPSSVAVVETKRPSEKYQYYSVSLRILPLLIECLD